MKRVGSAGNYQLHLVIVLSVVQYMAGGLFLIIPFLFYQDSYNCSSLGSSKNCYEYICSLPQEERYPYTPAPTINSISTQFGDFRCGDDKLRIEWLVSLMLAGKTIGALSLSFIGGLLGLKNLLVSNLFITILGMVLTLMSSTLTGVGIGLFWIILGIQNSAYCCYSYLTETVSEPTRSKYMIIIQLAFGLGVLLNPLWVFISSNWASTLFIYYFLPLLATTAAMCFMIADTPICLINRYNTQEALQAFRYIAKVNQMEDCDLEEEDISEVKRLYKLKLQAESQSQNKKFSGIDLFRYKSIRGLSIGLILLNISLGLQFFGPALILEEFQPNIFVNGIILGLSEFIAYPFCYFIISYTKRKTLAYWCFAVAAGCQFILMFVWKQGDRAYMASGN
jgi:hypothetical protein